MFIYLFLEQTIKNIGDKMKPSFKSYLIIPLTLTLFLANTKVQADEIEDYSVETINLINKIISDELNKSLNLSSSSEEEDNQASVAIEETIAQGAILPSESASESELASLIEDTLTDSNTGFYKRQPTKKADVSSGQKTEAATINSFTATQYEDSLIINYTDNVPQDSEVRVAVWSQIGNQDDLKWYTLQNGQVVVPYNNHWEYGLYHLHAYFRQRTTGKMSFVKAKEITLEQPQLNTKIIPTSQTSFDVVISNVPSYFHKLYVPIWSAGNGQDDLKWYEGIKQINGTYKVSVDIDNHKSSTGLYHIHYYEGKPNGKKAYIGQSRYNQPIPKAPELTVQTLNNRQFEVTITNVPAKYTKVLLPTWTEKNGQDDLKWYQAHQQVDGSYKVTISLDNHKFETDNYHLHLYGEVRGKKTFLAGTTYSYPKATVTKISDEQFTVTVTNVPSYIDQVRIPTWTEKNGQDDIKWYVAEKQTDGSYHLTVNIKDHKYESGLYHIHVYGNAGQVKNIFLNANTSYNVVVPKPETTIQSVNETSFKVIVNHVPSYVSSVVIPTWSAYRSQDDIKWYQAQKQVDGSYRMVVNIKDHKYDTGLYHVHAYGRTTDGKLVFLDGDKIEVKELPKPTATLRIENVNNETGSFDVVVSDLKSSTGIKLVQLPTWSEVDGQDDLRWYTVQPQSDGTYRLSVKASNHKYSSGKYHVHLYVTDERGKREFVAGKVVEKNAINYFIDISSHNGNISVAEFQNLKQQGILGVVVKLTEGTTYTNPFARAQITNATAAGLKVSVYHYSHYTSENEAKNEAQYFVQKAKEFGLSKNTVMINDIEETKMQKNLNQNTQAWLDQMKASGFKDNMLYTGANWLDIRGGDLNTSQFGYRNIWVAHYTKGYAYMTQAEAKHQSHYKEFGAWQYTSVSPKLSRHHLDENIDYTGRLT